MMRLIYYLTMARSHKMIVRKYGRVFWNQFKQNSYQKFHAVCRQTPSIGKSVFSFNYAYAPAYVAWYRSALQAGLNTEQADELLWHMNEKMLLTVPKPFLHWVGKTYLSNFRKKAKKHMERQKAGLLHPFDWEIVYRDIDDNSFEINITRCGFLTFAQQFGAEGMLPGICNVDYMLSYYMGNGFRRTQTLGYGDFCCDCHYELTGECPIRPTGNLK